MKIGRITTIFYKFMDRNCLYYAIIAIHDISNICTVMTLPSPTTENTTIYNCIFTNLRVSGILADVKISRKSKKVGKLEELIAEIIAVSKHKLDAQLSNSLTHEINAFGHASRAMGLDMNLPRLRYRLMNRQCSTKKYYEETVLDSFEL